MASPVTLTEAQQHLRLSNQTADEMTALNNMIEAATRYAEDICKRDFGETTQALVFDGFPASYLNDTADNCFRVPGGPIASVDSITYYDTDDTEQTVDPADYRVVTKHSVSRVYPAFSGEWPKDCNNEIGSVTVTVTYDDPASDRRIASIKSAILLIVGALYENREDGVIDQGIVKITAPIAATDLLSSLRTRY